MTTPTWTLDQKNEVLNEGTVLFNQVGIKFNQLGILFGGVQVPVWTLTNKNT